MKLLSTAVYALSIAACGGSVGHSGGSGEDSGGSAGTADVGSGGTGAAGANSGGLGSGGSAAGGCTSYADCPVPQLCQQCLDDLIECARVECTKGVCVNVVPTCGTGEAGGAAGAGGAGGAAGTGDGGDACRMLVANVYQALAEAQACNGQAGQCQTTVLTPCGCEVPVANGPNSYTTFAYQAALNQASAANCGFLCPGIDCLSLQASKCVPGDAGSGVCATD